MPAAHRPAAVVGILDAVIVEALFERRNIVGAERNVATVHWIDHLPGAEARPHVLLGNVKLRGAVGDERDVASVALCGDALLRERRLDLEVEYVAIELVHRADILCGEIEMMQLEFHICSSLILRSPRSGRLEG